MESKLYLDLVSLTNREKLALKDLKTKLSVSFRVEEIVLFGSKARGDYTEDSDVDLLVVVEEDARSEERSLLGDIAFYVNFEHSTGINCILENSTKWKNKEYWEWPFIMGVREEGISLEF